ncbi:DUF262 domain-containing protein [Succinatimonas hippei]|uniref:DUF262 domain-containing protein n=1 Tax=Succinatimonas hippei (strain DSM 22608 / JCM 16073 / KCTC 15190 / YIT 12066) TaxID=762983 RepID=E8LHH1_SUCHY|nr:DUF262 domain-containing protein [Succinatimonas hippei]EFY07990.1 hypothetical protein HMPREF9444_00144 [Succinatimonas hippei YIT 12066]
MATTISVNKQSVAELLKTGRTKPFIIPEYQRPYAWTSEQVETLFEDIWEFATTIGGLDRNGSYFLGSIVSFENENSEQEIIDGQQRITSLFLLLRAIYTKLNKGDDVQTDAAQNFIRQIEPAIWRTDNRTGKVDYNNILLTSRVVDNEGNEILRNILKDGMANPDANDNYSKNYLLFQKLYDDHCAKSPLKVYDFIYALLNQAILLPICADSQDTALTIFSTLNNRGLPLSDADIFKAKIYNNLKDDEKEKFISQWKALEKEATEAHESIQQLFYYYMFYLRAKENDVSSTTPGVRKYYSTNKSERLFEPNLMERLKTVLNLWKVVNTNQDIPEENWDDDAKIRKALDILTSYPNEYWKYPVINYYLSHRNREMFNTEFLLFLNKLIEELMTRFLLFPNINAVKSDIMKLNAKIINDPHPDFDFREIDKSLLESQIRVPHRNIVRMLMKCYAYNHQEQLLPDNWQLEHILPRKWQESYFPDVDAEKVYEMIEHIGNKTPFERKLNIIASNGYFKKKQQEYQKSKIEVTKILIASTNNDWTLENIEHRDKIVATEIMQLLQDWESNYQKNRSNATLPTEEDLAMIEKFKQKGWI